MRTLEDSCLQSVGHRRLSATHFGKGASGCRSAVPLFAPQGRVSLAVGASPRDTNDPVFARRKMGDTAALSPLRAFGRLVYLRSHGLTPVANDTRPCGANSH